MSKPKGHRFVSEVHFGLLVIILILIGLNFATNYVLYQGRIKIRGNIEMRLNRAVLSISRSLPERAAPILDPDQKGFYRHEYELTGLFIVPLKAAPSQAEAQRLAFLSMVENLPASQVPQIARKLLNTRTHLLTRGDGSEYFFSHTIPSSVGNYLLVLSISNSSLAYLDDVSENLMWLGILASVAVLGIYLLLLRYILSPFRKLRQKALGAGRPLDSQYDEVEGTIADYLRLISELKESESKLKTLNQSLQIRADSLEEYNRYLLDNMEAGLVSLGADGAIVSLNQEAEQLLGLKLSDAKERSYHSVLNGSPKLIENVDRCLNSKTNIGYDYYDFHSTGGIKTLGVSITFVEPGGERIKGCSLLISDQTELRQLEKELATRERLSALGEMASGLAHQLRNSMGAVLGFGTLIRKKQARQETDPKSLHDLMAEVIEAESLISRFLDFARPLSPMPEPVNITAYLTEVVHSCRSRLENENASIELNISEDCELVIDPLLIKQAISNIIDNAVIAYGSEKGVVEVSFAAKGSMGIIVISDNGPGIAEKIRANIFTPFYSTRPSGSGLGLPLAARIVESHNGRIEVQSESGRGTIFSIYLPFQSSTISNDQKAAIQLTK